jgi:hypothetical protein
MRCTPVRYTPMRHTREMDAHKVPAHEMHAREVHAHEVRAHEMPAHKVQAHETYAREMHAHETHAYKAYPHEIYCGGANWSLAPYGHENCPLEHLLEIARTHTDSIKQAFYPKRVSRLCPPIIAMPSPIVQPAVRHTLIPSTIHL